MPERYSSQLPLILCFWVSSGNAPSSGPNRAGKACVFKGLKKKLERKGEKKASKVTAPLPEAPSLVTSPEGARLGFQNRLGAARPQEATGLGPAATSLQASVCTPNLRAQRRGGPRSRYQAPPASSSLGFWCPSFPAPLEPSSIPAAISGLLPHLFPAFVHLWARPAQRTSAWRPSPSWVRRDAGRGLGAGMGARGRAGSEARGGATVSRQPIKTRGALRGGRTRLEMNGARSGFELRLAASAAASEGCGGGP